MTGVGDRINPRTGQLRVNIHHDHAKWFEEQVGAGADFVTAAIDIEADKDLTLFLKTVQNFTISIEVSDDTDADPDWYTLCDSTGAAITFTAAFNPGRAIPVSIKAAKMRITGHNNGAQADNIYIGVM